MTQEQLDQLSQEIVKVSRQIEILNGPEFADTVPQVESAKEALIAYKDEAEAQIRAHQAQAAAAPAANPFGQIDMQALVQLVAALRPAGTAQAAAQAAPAPQAAAAANPLAGLLAALARSAVPAAQG